MIEVWKDVKGFEGLYEVSNLGNVRSLKRNKILKPECLKKGYLRVKLFGVVIKRFQVHRLVAESFISNPENKPQVNHINGIKTDNRVENLEWCNNSENQKHAFKIGLSKIRRGVNAPNRKLTEKDVMFIRKHTELNGYKLAQMFNIDNSTIYLIRKNKIWN